jgi:hypothetical protein
VADTDITDCNPDRTSGCGTLPVPENGITDARRSWLSKIALVLVRLHHVFFIVNANHGIMWSAKKLRVINSVIRFGVPQPTEWQRIGDEIKAAPVLRGWTS